MVLGNWFDSAEAGNKVCTDSTADLQFSSWPKEVPEGCTVCQDWFEELSGPEPPSENKKDLKIGPGLIRHS